MKNRNKQNRIKGAADGNENVTIYIFLHAFIVYGIRRIQYQKERIRRQAFRELQIKNL